MLATTLAARIARDGPVRLDHWIGACNTAYYARSDAIGANFTTAPEVSQVFGELLGLWAADLWQRAAAPDPVQLAELGPGRGTLMADALRATARVPGFHAAAAIHLVETSPALAAEQRARLPASARWHESLATIPDGPLLVIANEFLDALPVRRFVATTSGPHETHVTRHENGFAATNLPAAADAPVPPALATAAPGTAAEVAEAAAALVGAIARRLARDGGAALLIDYGTPEAAPGTTLQALRHGRPASPYDHPGEADLTTHVAFAPLARAATAAGARAHGPVTQGALLAALGLHERTDALARANPARAASLRAAAVRLTAPAQMGGFLALALTGDQWPQPAGFPA